MRATCAVKYVYIYHTYWLEDPLLSRSTIVPIFPELLEVLWEHVRQWNKVTLLMQVRKAGLNTNAGIPEL